MTVLAMCKGRQETVIQSRTVPNAVVREALVIFLLAIVLICTAFGLLLWTEAPLREGDAPRLVFETVSATATVGLSIDVTSALSTLGRLVIIVCMFVGRLGPLAIGAARGRREEASASLSRRRCVVG
jgi:trk system potassium uptake protein TrkH